MKIAFVGASGYGNVGDDTYPLVFAKELAEHDLVFFNSDLPASIPDDIGLMVLGGGGLLYNNPPAESAETESMHFKCMKFYLETAARRGIPWGFLSCGFQFRSQHQEAAIRPLLNPWIPWLQGAAFVTVRSPSCQRIANELGERKDTHCFPDAAYLLDAAASEQEEGPRQVTVIPAGAINPLCPQVQHYVRQFSACGVRTVWMSMGARVDDGRHLEEAARRFPGSVVLPRQGPREVLRQIQASRLVISGRYHGMVFSRIAGVPCITPLHAPYKLTHEDFTLPMSEARQHFRVLREHLAREGG